MPEISVSCRSFRFSSHLAGLLLLASVASGLVAHAAEVGETKILKWKDGKTAVFLLAFDDSCPTHLTNVIPELEKRGIVGNFYVVPGKGTLPPKKAQWEKAAKSPVEVPNDL